MSHNEMKGCISWWLSGLINIEIEPLKLMEMIRVDPAGILIQAAKVVESESCICTKSKGNKKRVVKPRHTKKGGMYVREDILDFIVLVKKLGVRSELVFELEDLINDEGEEHVINTLYEFAKVSWTVHQVRRSMPDKLRRQINGSKYFHKDVDAQCTFS